MQQFETDIERILNEFGGEQKVTKNAEAWFDDIKQTNSKTKNVSKTNIMSIGKLYKFEYDCDQVNYNTNPLVLCLDADKDFAIGLNFNFLPTKVARKTISIIRNSLHSSYNDALKTKPFDSEAQNAIQIPKSLLQGLIKSLGVDFAIRHYKFSNIQKPYSICYEDWNKAIFLRNPIFIGKLTEAIYISEFFKNFTKK
jgi:hypothetical protein